MTDTLDAAAHRTRNKAMATASVAIASFALGALTSYAQGFLPDDARSFANSASGWTLVTAGLVFWSRLPARWAAPLGATSFVLLVLGYTVAAEFRGFHYEPLRFSVVGFVVGPFIGTAAAWLRASPLPAALATSLLAGIGIGEATYGLTTISETTSPAYWVAIGIVGVALVVAMIANRIRGAPSVATVLVGTPVVACVFIVAFRVLGGVGLA
ncbi:MAG: DUF6518 family protein [Actinomycetia bacterium]|nr:DUF6518 family protein [Actinomycetes bacterium]